MSNVYQSQMMVDSWLFEYYRFRFFLRQRQRLRKIDEQSQGQVLEESDECSNS